MKIIYLHDACHALGIDSATLYRWLKRSKMNVQTDEIDKRKRYISQADFRKLAHLHGKQLSGAYRTDAMQGPDESNERIAQIESETAELRTRIEALEMTVRRLTVYLSTKETPKILNPPKTNYNAKATVSDELVSLASFAERHGVSKSEYKRWAKDANMPKGRGGKYFVDEAVAAAFYQRFHQSTGFHRCETCPHGGSHSAP